jgi:DJ-1 family protein
LTEKEELQLIYVFLADGFEETEALVTVDILRRAQLDVRTAGVGAKQVTGSHGITVVADMTEAEIEKETITAVVLPGGMPGTLNLEQSEIVKDCVRCCAENGRFICAICAAPSILAHMGLLDGKNATCFPSFEKELANANLTGAPAVADGNIITGKGAGATVEFALLAAEKMAGKEISAEGRAALQCP